MTNRLNDGESQRRNSQYPANDKSNPHANEADKNTLQPHAHDKSELESRDDEEYETQLPIRMLRRQQKGAFRRGEYPDTRGVAKLKAAKRRRHGSVSDAYGPHQTDSQPGSEARSRQSRQPMDDPSPGLAKSKLGTGPSPYDPQPFDRVLRQMSRAYGWSKTLNVATIAARWPEIAGEDVAAHCVVETFDENVLVIRTDSTAWANQMKFLLPTLEKNIREVLGTNAVKQVIIRGPAAPSWRKGRLHVKGRGPRDTYG